MTSNPRRASSDGDGGDGRESARVAGGACAQPTARYIGKKNDYSGKKFIGGLVVIHLTMLEMCRWDTENGIWDRLRNW